MGDLGSSNDASSSTKTTTQTVALQNGGVGIVGSNNTIKSVDPEIVKGALAVSNSIANSAYETIYKVIDSSNAFYNRAQQSVDNAVAAAQQTALQAAPVSPGSYAEAAGAQSNKSIIIVAIVIGSIVVLSNLSKK